jgi:hypothetical protein
MLRLFLPLALVLAPLAATAQVSPARIAGLYEALGLPEVVQIMREEGLRYGGSIEEEMFPGGGGEAWSAAVSAIYDAAEMDEVVRARMAEAMPEAAVDASEDFFRSDRGQRIVGLEVSARRALLDPAVEDEARATAEAMRLDGDPRVGLVGRFADANQLVEQNVAGALNANLAFYKGLDAGGAFPRSMTETEILADVWGQEPEVRADTEDWVYSFLLLAYAPLSEGDLEAYISFSETEEGQALNRALFGAFDGMFTGISRDLGLAAARFIASQPL